MPIDATTLAPAPGRDVVRAAIYFAAALAVCLVVYVAATVPGSWFPSASPKTWTAREFTLTRGAGGVDGDALVVTAIDASGLALVTLNTNFRSTDYPTIAWAATGASDGLDVRLLWSSDYAPSKVNSAPVAVASGKLLPVALAGDPNWVGRITGLALAIRGPLPQPLRVTGMVAKPMGVTGVLRDRVAEWLDFEPFNGTTINTVTGGAEVQELPLPVLLVVALSLAAALWYALARRAGNVAALPIVLAALFVIASLLLDARWTWNLARQADATAAKYAGKDWHARHLAAEDGPLFAFIEKVRAKLPATPARVIVAADADYFRGRGAFHLYPHNVFFDARHNVMPAPSALRPGDYLVVYQRRGVQFDPAQQKLRWDGFDPVSAELLLAEGGGAAFRIR